MKLNEYIISLIFFGVLLITSFVPFVQVILMYWNGGILAITEDITGIDGLDLAIPLNLILTIVSLIAYFKSKTIGMKILLAVLSMFFINGLTVFGFEKIFGNSDANFYAWQFIVGALLTGLGLFTADILRHKLNYE
ncbi:MAG: hypothetical protein P8P29_05035 [Flavobacteriaceae bacterium]|nr:hypothetical protein [Flavobacteriaceae bacterium]